MFSFRQAAKMSTNTCRSPELEHLDLFIFSLLFSRSVAFSYIDVCTCFIFFYMSFYIIHATRDENMCSQENQTTHTSTTSINDMLWWYI